MEKILNRQFNHSLLINSCVSCPNSLSKFYKIMVFYCSKKDKGIDLDELSKIPKWCPLRNFKNAGIVRIKI